MSVLDMISSGDGTPEQYVQFKCPGYGNIHCLGVGPKASGPRWGWNGDKAKPTFTPSVLVKGNKLTFDEQGKWNGGWERDGQGNLIPYVCHSFITDGQIQLVPQRLHACAGWPAWRNATTTLTASAMLAAELTKKSVNYMRVLKLCS